MAEVTSLVVPEEVAKRLAGDADAILLLKYFQESGSSKILVIGAHDEVTTNYIASLGFDVTGIDLREYDPSLPPCNFNYIRGDFCDVSIAYLQERIGTFDAVICLSAIEHFGMGTYKEGKFHRYYDVIAMRRIWDMLRDGGKAYVTFPTGGFYTEVYPHWRVYDYSAVMERLVQDFEVLHFNSVSAEHLIIDGKSYKIGDTVTAIEVNKFTGMPPSVSSILVLKKNPIHRISPDGV